MKQIDLTHTINAPVAKVWQAFVDPSVIETWGAGPAQMSAEEGGQFSLWGGDIHGINTKIVPEKLLEQDWYGHDHPERCYKVKYLFESNGSRTAIHLIHTDVPDEEVKEMENDWRDYYLDPIKKLLEG